MYALAAGLKAIIRGFLSLAVMVILIKPYLILS
jgi:hypothetical protein